VAVKVPDLLKMADPHRFIAPIAGLYRCRKRRWQGSEPFYSVGMLNEIYNQRILTFAANIPRLGRLAKPQASATAHSKLCGSTVTVDIVMNGDKVTDFAHDVKACALGQASSSIMAHHVVGSSASELRALRNEMHAMLKGNGRPPSGKWKDLEILEPVRDYKARHASTLLTFDAVVDAIGKVEATRGEAISA
jgi:NifU-like protein involved in Fe-S cluster formation